MARRFTYWIVTAIVLVALAEAAFSENLPTVGTTTFAASVPAQARIEVDAAGQIVSVFNITDGIGVQPGILNVYRDGVKIMVTPQITQELDSICSKIDWRCGGVVYQRKEGASLSDVGCFGMSDVIGLGGLLYALVYRDLNAVEIPLQSAFGFLLCGTDHGVPGSSLLVFREACSRNSLTLWT